MEAVLFYIFASLAVIGGLLMVGIRNPLGGAFCLVISLVSLAALFAMQNAEFIIVLGPFHTKVAIIATWLKKQLPS